MTLMECVAKTNAHVSLDESYRRKLALEEFIQKSLAFKNLSSMSGIQQESLERGMPAPNSPPLKPELTAAANLFNDPNFASIANQMLSQHYLNQTLMSLPNLNAALNTPLLFHQYQRYHQAIAALTIPSAMPSPPVPMQQPTSPVSPALSSASASSAAAINNNNNSVHNNNDNSVHNNNNNNNSNINNNNEVVSSSCADKLRKAKPKKRATKVTKVEVAVANGAEEPVAAAAVPEIKTPGKDRNFTCQVCFRSFGYKHVLQNHERTHTGEKPFECLECHKRFTRDHHLKTHMRLHTGEKPYHCTHCDRQFVQVANLRRHLRVHTGERPYACELCKAKFSDSNQLKSHMLIHKDEKPFKCDHCETNFRRKHHLDVHKCKALAAARATVRSRVAAVSPPLAAFSTSSASSNSSSGGSACSGRLSHVGSLSPCSLDLEDEAMAQEKQPAQLLSQVHQQPTAAIYLRPSHAASSIMQDVPFSNASVNLTSAAPAALAFQTPVQTEPEDLSIRGSGRISDETSIRPDSRASSSSPFSPAPRDEDENMQDKTDLSAR